MHGDEVDTSIMLFLRPELVNLDLAQDYMMSREQLRRYRRGWLTVPSGSAGSIGRPSLSSADKGKLLYERIFASGKIAAAQLRGSRCEACRMDLDDSIGEFTGARAR